MLRLQCYQHGVIMLMDQVCHQVTSLPEAQQHLDAGDDRSFTEALVTTTNHECMAAVAAGAKVAAAAAAATTTTNE